MAVYWTVSADPALVVDGGTSVTAAQAYGPASLTPYHGLTTVTEPVRATWTDSGQIIPTAALSSTPSLSYRVRIQWDTNPGNAFILNESALNGTAVLQDISPSWFSPAAFDYAFFDVDKYEISGSIITSDVMSIQTKRGRDSNLSNFDAGEAVVQLYDPNGTYSPMNSASPLYPNVKPGRPIYIEALLNGSYYGMFMGTVRSIEHHPEATARTTTLHCQDLFLALSRNKPIITGKGGLTTGTAIARVLDAAGWKAANRRQLGYGDDLPGTFGPFRGDQSALDIIQDLLTSERGEFFQGRDGVCRYFYRTARLVREPGFLLNQAVNGAIPATDLTNIRNKAIVTATGYGTATWSDGLSIANYGPSEITLTTNYVGSVLQATGLAQWLVSQTSSATPPVRTVEFIANTEYGRAFIACALEIGDRIRLKDATRYIDEKEYFVEGIEHSVSDGGKIHRTSLSLSQVNDSKPLVFDTSRNVAGTFSSPTVATPPYTTTGTTSGAFAY